MATYARINLNILSSISDIYRLFGSACCNWQSLLTSYSVWWNGVRPGLQLDRGDRHVVGLTAAQPVLPEMVPGSTYLSGLNSAPNLLREAIVIPTRVGIASTAHNFYWGGALRAAFPITAMRSRRGETSPDWEWTTPLRTSWRMRILTTGRH